ncbi:MAG: fumarylacetoacetate hydrolase family protein [Microbacteriaceae bacterium]|nr:fumarylacetoacetate hydrolase family protein [Microbacteriaceae bacterium]
MRLARWIADGAVAEGVVYADRMLAFTDGTTVRDLLETGLDAALEMGRRTVDTADGSEPRLDEVRLLAPLVPASIRDFVAFEEHVEGVAVSVDGRGGVPEEWYRYPTFYFTNPHSVLGPGDEVVPPRTEALDFELELAAVIGPAPRGGANLTPTEGAAAIFGYTIMNDWSARDVQGREMQVRLGPAKGKDFGTSLGPVLVTADEFADLIDDEGFLALRAEARVDGVLVGDDLISNMGWPFGELVAYASRNTRVVPGDVLGSGTTGHGGCLAELWGRAGERVPPPLSEGSVVALSIERIGELTGRVGAPVPVPDIPPARPRSRARTR